jgi:hypothetical protein
MDKNQSGTEVGKDSGKATAEKVFIERRKEPRVNCERTGNKDSSVLGKINDE